MQRLADEGLIERDGLSFYESTDVGGDVIHVGIRGRLACVGGVLIHVDKRLHVRRGARNHLEVRTYSYQYHAWIRIGDGRPRRDVIRYDNSKVHRGELHRHLFDARGEEVEVSPVPLDEMPTLSEFVRMALDIARR